MIASQLRELAIIAKHLDEMKKELEDEREIYEPDRHYGDGFWTALGVIPVSTDAAEPIGIFKVSDFNYDFITKGD